MDVRAGEAITIGNNVRVHFLEKSGRLMRVRVAAPVDVRVQREQVDDGTGVHRALIPSMAR